MLAPESRPSIFNIDQGSQFTRLDFTGVLKDAKAASAHRLLTSCLPTEISGRMYQTRKTVSSI